MGAAAASALSARFARWQVSWSWKPFQNSARKDQLELHHWVKEVEGVPPAKDYSFSKYNKHATLIVYDDEEYVSLVAALDPNWNRVETDHLMDLCKRFDLRFPQMQVIRLPRGRELRVCARCQQIQPCFRAG